MARRPQLEPDDCWNPPEESKFRQTGRLFSSRQSAVRPSRSQRPARRWRARRMSSATKRWYRMIRSGEEIFTANPDVLTDVERVNAAAADETAKRRQGLMMKELSAVVSAIFL